MEGAVGKNEKIRRRLAEPRGALHDAGFDQSIRQVDAASLNVMNQVLGRLVGIGLLASELVYLFDVVGAVAGVLFSSVSIFDYLAWFCAVTGFGACAWYNDFSLIDAITNERGEAYWSSRAGRYMTVMLSMSVWSQSCLMALFHYPFIVFLTLRLDAKITARSGQPLSGRALACYLVIQLFAQVLYCLARSRELRRERALSRPR